MCYCIGLYLTTRGRSSLELWKWQKYSYLLCWRKTLRGFSFLIKYRCFAVLLPLLLRIRNYLWNTPSCSCWCKPLFTFRRLPKIGSLNVFQIMNCKVSFFERSITLHLNALQHWCWEMAQQMTEPHCPHGQMLKRAKRRQRGVEASSTGGRLHLPIGKWRVPKAKYSALDHNY